MTRDELRQIVADAIQRGDPGAVKEILDAAGQYAAHVAEKVARPYPWPPPARRREGSGRKAS
jgi:hypothetical protein